MKKSLVVVLMLLVLAALCSAVCADDEVSYADLIKVDWTEDFADLSTGIKMAYTYCGPEDGTPIILIHGVTDGRISWSQVAPMLADLGYRVYVPEYRGNGKTDKPVPESGAYEVDTHAEDMVAFMDAVGIEKAHVAGHSLGSLIAQRMNVLHPDRLLSTILIDSTVNCSKSEVLDWAQNGDGTDYLGVHGYDAEGAMPDDFLVSWAENSNEDADFQAATIAHLRQMPYECWGWLIDGLNKFDNSADLDKISGKVLIIWGTEDAIFPESDQEELKAGLTNCDYTFLPMEGASHNCHWDSIDTRTELVKDIDEFIKGL